MKKHYNLTESEFELINLNLISFLEEFDLLWTQYENIYVHELMVIESQSRRYISDAILAESQLSDIEKLHKESGQVFENVKNKSDLLLANQSFTKVLAKINSVANFEGHGRDDLSVEILQAANEVLLKITACESQNLRKLAKKILESYQMLRDLFKKYNENIEIVDPQLRNNPDLVEALVEYEKGWEKGKIYLLNSKRCDQLIFFTNVIEGLYEKYPLFKENLECCDSEVFVQIPSIMLLKKVEREDNDICEVFLPQIMEAESVCYQIFTQIKADLFRINDKFMILREKNVQAKKSNNQNTFSMNEKSSFGYKTLLKSNKQNSETGKNAPKKFNYDFYNFLEKKILSEVFSGNNDGSFFSNEDLEVLDKSVLSLRHLSIEMQRFNPMEWNAFLDIAISK